MAGKRAMVIFFVAGISVACRKAVRRRSCNSVTTLDELPSLLGRIFHAALASAENSLAPMALEAQAGNNDDMMIRGRRSPITAACWRISWVRLATACDRERSIGTRSTSSASVNIDIKQRRVNMPTADGYSRRKAHIRQRFRRCR